jgi:hypothetical protein
MGTYSGAFMKEGTPCQHCKRRKNCKPRGLCYRCHTDPDVRALYPPNGAWGAAGALGAAAELTPLYPASRPTYCRPGTVGKFLELCRRYAAREALWHPRDARA